MVQVSDGDRRDPTNPSDLRQPAQNVILPRAFAIERLTRLDQLNHDPGLRTHESTGPGVELQLLLEMTGDEWGR
jgi:hypothetical protein